MKRTLQLVFALAAVLTLSVQALAVNADDFWYQDDSGVRVYDQAGYNLACAQEKVQAAGISLDPLNYLYTDANGEKHFDTAAFEAAYAAAVVAKAPPQAEKPEESAGVKNDGHVSGNTQESDDKFPVGSYIDPDGRVWSPNGELLSNGPSSSYAPVEDSLLSDELLSDPDIITELDVLTTIAGLVSEIEDDSPTYHVVDLRPADTTIVVPDGLKALIVSIFGEYRPVMTTALVSETVGDDVYQYYVETVAPGSAGVDYEWPAGVFLFGILLFCLMKLLGGVLK